MPNNNILISLRLDKKHTNMNGGKTFSPVSEYYHSQSSYKEVRSKGRRLRDEPWPGLSGKNVFTHSRLPGKRHSLNSPAIEEK